MKHHPNYIPTTTHSSRLSCEVIDKLALELGVSFQHIHYDGDAKQPVGDEYQLTEYRQKRGVDGAFMYDGSLALFEFQGDYWHGHPRKHGKGTTITYRSKKVSFEELFTDTERIMREVIGRTKMRLFYCWEWDYDRLMEGESVWPIVREFKGTLEWK